MSLVIGAWLFYVAFVVFVLLPIGLVIKALTPNSWWEPLAKEDEVRKAWREYFDDTDS